MRQAKYNYVQNIAYSTQYFWKVNQFITEGPQSSMCILHERKESNLQCQLEVRQQLRHGDGWLYINMPGNKADKLSEVNDHLVVYVNQILVWPA